MDCRILEKKRTKQRNKKRQRKVQKGKYDIIEGNDEKRKRVKLRKEMKNMIERKVKKR